MLAGKTLQESREKRVWSEKKGHFTLIRWPEPQASCLYDGSLEGLGAPSVWYFTWAWLLGVLLSWIPLLRGILCLGLILLVGEGSERVQNHPKHTDREAQPVPVKRGSRSHHHKLMPLTDMLQSVFSVAGRFQKKKKLFPEIMKDFN